MAATRKSVRVRTTRVIGVNGKRYPTSYAENREAIREAIEANPQATNVEIARRFNSSRDTVIEVRRAMADPTLSRDDAFARIPLARIQVGARHRTDHGDIDALARSIESIGLLHPIVVTPGLELIAGERRLLACARLQWDSVPVRMVNLQRIVLGEYAENELRTDFDVSERVAIGQAIEAQLGNRQGMRTDIHGVQLVENSPQVQSGAKSREVAARQAGFGSDKTYRDAKRVIARGAPELIDAVDTGHASIHAAAVIATVSPNEQREIVAQSEAQILRAAKQIRARLRAQASPAPLASSDTPAFLPPSKALSDNERVFKVTESIRNIATSDLRPEEIQSLLKPFMWPEVTEFLDSALSFLGALKQTWRSG